MSSPDEESKIKNVIGPASKDQLETRSSHFLGEKGYESKYLNHPS